MATRHGDGRRGLLEVGEHAPWFGCCAFCGAFAEGFLVDGRGCCEDCEPFEGALGDSPGRNGADFDGVRWSLRGGRD